jgi:hypothetical protein
MAGWNFRRIRDRYVKTRSAKYEAVGFILIWQHAETGSADLPISAQPGFYAVCQLCSGDVESNSAHLGPAFIQYRPP